ncbi:hypothetical protein M758_8G085900 [Ceratodon purpureus]|uniref:Uncharacterized protein n=1 Tax=Ceratodon purpureus TaxID=3225 RepID=A0A8T0H1E6_CERPU|nr:hypothetical protein KC19_8G090100 [Ceratodon purpureus]KAG0608189.1 hypothetical protein M758_8G085900 [Ceratodon purpureus]
MADKGEITPLGVALKEAERGATKSGGEALVEAVLECASKEIGSSSLRSLYSDAAEFSAKRAQELPRDVYERAQRKMANALGVRQVVDGQVVGHALMRASEGGQLNVVRRLRKGQAELRCSVLTPRFLAFALLKAADIGQVEVVEELLRSTNSAVLAMVGHELATKVHTDQYPFITVALTKDWQRKVSGFKSLLPSATYVLQFENLELRGVGSDQETVHEAVRSCYQMYCVWRLMVVAAANGHGGVFREFLMKREDFTARAGATRQALMGYEHPKVAEFNKVRTRIDDEFMRFTSKVTAKLSRDMLLYEIYRSNEGNSVQDGKKGGNAWRCTSKAQFGLWEVLMEVPVLLMEVEGSYQDNDKKQLMRNYHYIKPIIPQIMKLNVQFKVIIDIQPNYAELSVGVNHVRVTFDNQRWEEAETGHFPTRVSLSVTPVAQTLTSVTMTGSSTNTSYKVGVAENVRIGINATLKAAPTAGISFQAGKGTTSKIDGKPWRMEQLPVYNERGGSYTWALTNLHGAGFDRLSPMLQETKTSIWQFGKRVPINPLMVLPFGTNGGVNFTGTEFDDTISWRFAKELENTMVQFNVEGQVHTTYITQDRFWETRVVPFEVKLEQKLEPCGDPAGSDKKKKKKKK